MDKFHLVICALSMLLLFNKIDSKCIVNTTLASGTEEDTVLTEKENNVTEANNVTTSRTILAEKKFGAALNTNMTASKITITNQPDNTSSTNNVTTSRTLPVKQSDPVFNASNVTTSRTLPVPEKQSDPLFNTNNVTLRTIPVNQSEPVFNTNTTTTTSRTLPEKQSDPVSRTISANQSHPVFNTDVTMRTVPVKQSDTAFITNNVPPWKTDEKSAGALHTAATERITTESDYIEEGPDILEILDLTELENGNFTEIDEEFSIDRVDDSLIEYEWNVTEEDPAWLSQNARVNATNLTDSTHLKQFAVFVSPICGTDQVYDEMRKMCIKRRPKFD